ARRPLRHPIVRGLATPERYGLTRRGGWRPAAVRARGSDLRRCRIRGVAQRDRARASGRDPGRIRAAVSAALDPDDVGQDGAIRLQLERAIARRALIERELLRVGQELRASGWRREQPQTIAQPVIALMDVAPDDAANVRMPI